MTKRWQFWVLSVIGAASLVLVAVNMTLYSRNQTLQTAVNRRSQYIQQTVQLQGLYRQIVQAVATLSMRDKDAQLQAILAKQGITVTTKRPAVLNIAPTREPAVISESRTKGQDHE